MLATIPAEVLRYWLRRTVCAEGAFIRAWRTVFSSSFFFFCSFLLEYGALETGNAKYQMEIFKSACHKQQTKQSVLVLPSCGLS